MTIRWTQYTVLLLVGLLLLLLLLLLVQWLSPLHRGE